MITASFNGIEFKNIEGYRISCCLTPGSGFAGRFYVYIDERRQAQTPFEKGIKVSDRSDEQVKPVRGTLSIKDEHLEYDFEDIDLTFAEIGATRRERTRYLEFRYDPRVTDSENAQPIKITGKKTTVLGAAGLGKQYMGGIGENRHLLGFKALVSASDGVVARFSNLGCMEKSFLERIVELNKEMQSGDKILSPFTVNFSQGDFEVTRDNLVAFYVEESRGSLSLQETPPVYSMIERTTTGAVVERLRPRGYSSDELLWHDAAREFKAKEVHPGTVETATLVFNQGYFDDLEVL